MFCLYPCQHQWNVNSHCYWFAHTIEHVRSTKTCICVVSGRDHSMITIPLLLLSSASSSITVRRVPIVPGQTYQFVIRARVGDIVSDNSLVITITSGIFMA